MCRTSGGPDALEVSPKARVRDGHAIRVVDLDVVAWERADDRKRHGESMIAVRHDATRQPSARPGDTHAVRAFLRPRTNGAEVRDHGRNAVAFLHAKLGGPADDRISFGARRHAGKEWELVDHRRHVGLANAHAALCPGRNDDVSNGFPALESLR